VAPEIIYILIGFVVLLILVLGIYFLLSAGSNSTSYDEALRNLVLHQRSEKGNFAGKSNAVLRGEAAILASKSQVIEKGTKDLERASLSQKIVFANWTITPAQFRILKYSITAIIGVGFYFVLEIPLIITAFLLTPKLVDSTLNRALKKRFNNFDKDFPDYLMTLVSRLKSGMNILQAMQSGVESMEDSSLLKQEVDLMLERIRVGYQEEKALSVFAEDIPHPEIELFTQVVILNKKVGGNFASTLERLAKQVRRRQEFRRKAVSVVSEQRGGALFISGIMGALLVFMALSNPELIEGCFTNYAGRIASQFGLSMVIFGFYLSRVVTNIKV